MTQYLRLALLAGACMALAACSTASRGGKINYYSTAAAPPPLEIPPDLTVPRSDEALPAPRSGGTGTGTSYSKYSAGRVATPAARDTVAMAEPSGSQPAAAAPGAPAMRIERAGTQRWLVVASPPAALWGPVRGFFAKSGLAIVLENKDAGILESDWAENRAGASEDFIQRYLGAVFPNLYDTGVRDKFRVRLEPGQQPGTADIFLTHRRLEEHVDEQVFGRGRIIWKPVPSDPDIEAEMLRLLMTHLGVQEKQADAVLAASGAEHARLRRNDKGAAVLNLDDDPERAWRRVGVSLDRVGFTVEDRDRTLGVYYVRYVDPVAEKKSKSLFGRVFGDNEEPDIRYQVTVVAAASGTDVGVRDSAGAVEQSGTGERMLQLLYEQLK